MSREELIGRLVEMATRPDYEGLVRRGILKRRSKNTYTVLLPAKVPKKLLEQSRAISVTYRNGKPKATITLKDESGKAQRTLDRMAAWVQPLIEAERQRQRS